MWQDQCRCDQSQAALSFLLLGETLCRVGVELRLQLVIRVHEAAQEAIVKLLEFDRVCVSRHDTVLHAKDPLSGRFVLGIVSIVGNL